MAVIEDRLGAEGWPWKIRLHTSVAVVVGIVVECNSIRMIEGREFDKELKPRIPSLWFCFYFLKKELE